MTADFGLPKRSPLGVVRWGGRSHLNRRHAPQAEFGLPPARTRFGRSSGRGLAGLEM